MKTPRTITITPVLNGFIVSVDCQKVVFPSRESLIDGLRRYYNDPAKVQQEFLEFAVNGMKGGPPYVAPDAGCQGQDINLRPPAVQERASR